MDKLCSLNQDLLSTLKNTLVAQKMEAWLDNFAQRWDNLVQKLEKSSAQVSDTNYSIINHPWDFLKFSLREQCYNPTKNITGLVFAKYSIEKTQVSWLSWYWRMWARWRCECQLTELVTVLEYSHIQFSGNEDGSDLEQLDQGLGDYVSQPNPKS